MAAQNSNSHFIGHPRNHTKRPYGMTMSFEDLESRKKVKMSGSIQFFYCDTPGVTSVFKLVNVAKVCGNELAI